MNKLMKGHMNKLLTIGLLNDEFKNELVKELVS